MREKNIEEYLRREVKRLGGIAYKFTSPGNSGVPDRLVLLPKGVIFFVELKAPGKRATEIQLFQLRRIKSLGFNCFILDSFEAIDTVLERFKCYGI